MKQLSMLAKPSPEFGGTINFKKRCTRRILSTKKPIHLVLKASRPVLFQNRKVIHKILKRQSKLAGVTLYKVSIQRDHIHHAIRITNRQAYCKFIRAVTGLLSRKFGRKLWKFRPYTRIAEWKRAFNNLLKYIEQNELEVFGVIAYQARKSKKPGVGSSNIG